jgi:bifunctional UDP-N-acetylglucosamine pyrophosphorylase/glucosamine-1-phosphate N-acetyltransferase
VRIVEHNDASPEELEIDEINTSFYVFKRGLLAPALRRITPDNAQGEYYLTDVVEVLSTAGHRVETLIAEDAGEMLGVNDRVQLAAAEAELRRRTNLAWLAKGVTMIDPAQTYIDASVVVGEDVTLFPGTLLQGQTRIGEHSEIGPDTRLVDTVVGKDCIVRSTFAVDAEIGDGAVVGPFGHLPPGSAVAPGSVTGPFYTSP